MKPKVYLFIIMIISLIGILFSGYLSYGELIKQNCSIGGCSTVAGVPACVYGFVMYLVVFILSILGLSSKIK
jgi:hypothetical protein